MLDPATVRLKPTAGDAQPFVPGQDYQWDDFWATFGRLENGAIAENQAVYADYEYGPCRLDSVVVTAAGQVTLKKGEPHIAIPHPPTLAGDEIALANVWVPGRLERLTEENVFPIEPSAALRQDYEPPRPPYGGTTNLPRTLAKLRAGQPVTIVAWGDSVTAGGGVGGAQEQWYQYRFLTLLRERFPRAEITLHTAAWPGGNSRGYLSSPAGSTYDFQRDVLDRNPDLVTIEFVNDAYLDEAATQTHYAGILERLKPANPEVILITPHFVRPDWMGVTTQKVDEDPRPYVAGLRRFAREHHLALADASRRWAHLWREGLPYMTLLANCINHPDERGHEMFAQALMELFPVK
jgi:lysophospholipase L1-like esterase